MIRGTGFIERPDAHRDPKESAFAFTGAARVPDEYLPGTPLWYVDQGPTNSCTGRAVVKAHFLWCADRGLDPVKLSADFVYAMGRLEDGLEHADKGAYPDSVLRAFRKRGACPESLWPSDDPSTVNDEPNGRALMRARDNGSDRVTWRAIIGSPAIRYELIREAIGTGSKVVGGFAIDRAFQANDGPELIAQQAGDIIGNHMVTLDGYRDDGAVRCDHSYGRTWRTDGRAFLTREFVELVRQPYALDWVAS